LEDSGMVSQSVLLCVYYLMSCGFETLETNHFNQDRNIDWITMDDVRTFGELFAWIRQLIFHSYDSFKISVGLPTTGGAAPPADNRITPTVKEAVDDVKRKF